MIWILTKSPENGTAPLFERNKEGFFTQENEVHPQSPTPEENQPENEIHSQSPSSEHKITLDIQHPHFKRIVRVILHILMVPHLLEKGGGILHLGRQMITVLKFEGVNMEEFLDDIFKLMKKYFYTLPWN